jgi:hypothetical protein
MYKEQLPGEFHGHLYKHPAGDGSWYVFSYSNGTLGERLDYLYVEGAGGNIFHIPLDEVAQRELRQLFGSALTVQN